MQAPCPSDVTHPCLCLSVSSPFKASSHLPSSGIFSTVKIYRWEKGSTAIGPESGLPSYNHTFLEPRSTYCVVAPRTLHKGIRGQVSGCVCGGGESGGSRGASNLTGGIPRVHPHIPRAEVEVLCSWSGWRERTCPHKQYNRVHNLAWDCELGLPRQARTGRGSRWNRGEPRFHGRVRGNCWGSVRRHRSRRAGCGVGLGALAPRLAPRAVGSTGGRAP